MNVHRMPFEFVSEQALTLVELLISMAVLSVGVLGVVAMFPVAHQHLRAGGDVTKATALAREMVELLRDEPLERLSSYHNADTRNTASFPMDDLSLTPPFHGGSSVRRWRDEIASEPLGGGLYRGWGRIEVAPLGRGLMSIAVTVGWPATPTERTVQLTTYLGQQ